MLTTSCFYYYGAQMILKLMVLKKLFIHTELEFHPTILDFTEFVMLLDIAARCDEEGIGLRKCILKSGLLMTVAAQVCSLIFLRALQ